MKRDIYKYRLVTKTVNVVDSLNMLGVPYSVKLVMKLVDMPNIQSIYEDIKNGVSLEEVWEKYDLPKVI